MNPIEDPCPRFVDRCAKMFRLDLVEQKYDCFACYDDEMQDFWTAWTEEKDFCQYDLTEQEAIKAYSPFRIEGTSIIAWQG